MCLFGDTGFGSESAHMRELREKNAQFCGESALSFLSNGYHQWYRFFLTMV
jgi:hypothetical protein